MNIRQSQLGMIKAIEGGWDAAAAILGMSRDALENRIYERRGQSVATETSMILQKVSGTKLFAESVASESGGVFVKLIQGEDVGQEDLHAKFQQLWAELGRLSRVYSEATADGEIDRREKAELNAVAQAIHKIMQELMTLMFAVYCREDDK